MRSTEKGPCAGSRCLQVRERASEQPSLPGLHLGRPASGLQETKRSLCEPRVAVSRHGHLSTLTPGEGERPGREVAKLGRRLEAASTWSHEALHTSYSVTSLQRCSRCGPPAGHNWSWVPGLAKGVWGGANSTHCIPWGFSNWHQQPRLSGELINLCPEQNDVSIWTFRPSGADWPSSGGDMPRAHRTSWEAETRPCSQPGFLCAPVFSGRHLYSALGPWCLLRWVSCFREIDISKSFRLLS